MTGTFEHSPADVVASVLTDVLGLTDVFVGKEDNDPDECYTVFDTTGLDQGRSMIDGGRWEYFGVQVRVRSPRQDRCGRLAWSLAKRLDEEVYDATVQVEPVVGTATAGYVVHAIKRTSGPIPLGKEGTASARTIFTLNLLAGIKQVS